MKKFVIYTTLILTLFFSVNTDALFHGDIVQILGNTDVLAQETPTNCGSYLNVGCHIKQAIGDGIQEIKSSIASQIEAATYGVLNIVLTYVGNAILWTFSWILFVAGMILNLTLQITVVNMSTLVNNIDAINDGWVLFRDLANITFIFILLYIAIATILELGVDTRKTITKVIIAALLINFSLFFTKVIVDGSNVLTINFYQLIGQTEGTKNNSTDGSDFNINDLDGGLSSAFMQNLKLTTLYNKDGTASTSALPAGTVEDTSESILSRTLSVIPRVVFGSLLMLLAAVIFFAVSIMFVVRFVVIVFLMITAPVAFVATILPQTSGISKKWWKSLTSQAIFAPVYMIMTFITLKIMSSVQNTDVMTTITSSNNAGANFIFSTNATGFVMIISFFIMFAFLVGTLVIAKMAGGAGSDWATKVGGRAVFGGVGWVGRNTVGRAGARLADRTREAAGDKNRSAATRWAARLALRGGEATSKASFDARNVAGSAASSVSSPLGGGKIDFSKIKKEQKGGFTKQRENAEKKRQEEAELLNPSKVEIIRAEQELAEAKDNPEALRKHREEKLAEIDNQILAYNKTIASTKDDFVKGNLGKRVTELTQQRAKYDVSDEEVIKSLQSKVDILKGVDEKEAKKRAEKEVEKISVAGFRSKSDEETTAEYEQHREMFYSSKYGTKTKEEAEKKHYQEKYNAETLEEARKKQATKIQKEHHGVGKERKEQFAKDIQNRSFLMRLLTLKTRAQLDREADAIRKGKKKTVEEIRDDLNKATGKTVSEDESEPSDGTKDPSKSEKS